MNFLFFCLSKGSRDHAVLKGNAELRQMVEVQKYVTHYVVHNFCIKLREYNCNYGILQAEERRRLEKENRAMIAEELERVKIETEHEKAEIKVRLGQKKLIMCFSGTFYQKKMREGDI